MLQSIERFLKQSIVDKYPSVSSAALVSSLHLYHINREVIKRCVNEVQEAMKWTSSIVQYHALGLMYTIKQSDKMAIFKLIQTLSRTPMRSPLATCMLIRYTGKAIEEEQNPER